MGHQHATQFLSFDLLQAFNFNNNVAGGHVVVTRRSLTFKSNWPNFFAGITRVDGNALVHDRSIQNRINFLPQGAPFTHANLAQQLGTGMTYDHTYPSGG